MIQPMKFWELTSAFRDRPDILVQVFSEPTWHKYLKWYRELDRLVAAQDRQVLDASIPLELSRQIAALYPVRFYFYTEMHLLREATIDRFPDVPHIELTALQVHDRFGGSVIEEVFEKGSIRVNEE
ncbi:MAG: hypothetical protein JW934_18680 [Anaerolineae bacterium]|nr:hypothetical protein [Anaerolineae bacterium]